MGLVIAVGLIGLWLAHGAYALLDSGLTPDRPIAYLHLALQTYLSTGLFITAHDAMHGTVSRAPRVNTAVGRVACFLFAGFSYRRLVACHRAHHHQPGTVEDPDFSPYGFWRWWFGFMARYTTLSQLAVMAVGFNVLKWITPEPKIWMFWVAPSLLASLQLFFFGTYLPHRTPFTPDMAPHRARTQAPGHLWAMASCYFFGYHWEHHQSPGTPWWKLWRLKHKKTAPVG